MMGFNSEISWTHHTFNPWIGCAKVSAGCTNCYAETLMDKRYGKVRWGKGQPRVLTSESNWKQPLRWNRAAEKLGERQRVFCASLADVFDAEVPEQWRVRLFDLIGHTPQLDWLLLTKRPENIEGRYLPLPNVWLGISVENQEAYDTRFPILKRTIATVQFLSVEPLLGPIDLSTVRHGSDPELPIYPDWVIVGGESGNGARPMHPEWARSLRDQCIAAGVPFHFKQWGEWAPASEVGCGCEHEDINCGGENSFLSRRDDRSARHVVIDMNGLDCTGWSGPNQRPPFAHMVRVGKKRSGRILDGRTWDELPQIETTISHTTNMESVGVGERTGV